MKKITLLFSAFFIFLLVFASPVYADKVSGTSIERSLNWLERTYAPELNLQPYFDFKQPYFLAAAAPCAVQTIPFLEGFNTGSPTLACWTIIDANKDSSSPTGSYIWRPYDYGMFEGTHSMYFSGATKNDDWLITPSFKLDLAKTYKLKYRYKTSSYYNNEFEVLASNNGLAVVDFTKVLVAKRVYTNDAWIEETVYITNYSGDVNLAWHVTTQGYCYVSVDSVSLEEVECVEAQNLEVKDLDKQQATIFWKDDVNKAWEYYIDEAAGNGPTTSGVATTTKEVVITKDFAGKNLTANTEYDYYVRAKCANGKFGEWVGPYRFRTLCNVLTAPLVESFNTSSTTFSCWTILDNNKDKTASSGNAWRQYASSTYEGDRTMYFYGSGSTTTHDDWLISPTVKMNGGIYAITYYYRTDSYTGYDNNFEVLLSSNGMDPVNFTQKLELSAKRNTTTYVKRVLYVKGITGDVNIAWHVLAKGTAYVYIDQVSIVEVTCIAPNDDIKPVKIEKDKAEVSWTDPNNTSWEYFVQPMGAGPAPIGSGSIANKPSTSFSKTSGTGGTNLTPNTWYDFFVRSSCGAGKTSLWVGPFTFKTPCDLLPLPFLEGFNTGSATVDCWTIIDNNKDKTTYDDNIWKPTTSTPFEGDRAMYFYGSNSTHDDWLISPTFKFDATKFYRLKYHYKTSASAKMNFDVLLSNKGIKLTDFTQVLVSEKAHINAAYTQVTAIIGGVGGDVNIAWHVLNDGTYINLYVDKVSIEEVVGCPEPMALDSKDEKETSATIFWKDGYGKDWEYIVQKAGGKVPTTATGTGTVTTTRENTVTKEQSGTALLSNTEYEFYVRTSCGNEESSIWAGPFIFKTACGLFTTPFWEGFNKDSKSLTCWTIIDENNDSTSPTGSNIWRPYDYGQYEGSQMMYFNGYMPDQTKLPHNDWLVSPKIKFEASKTYRLKYHYKFTTTTSYDYEFEVVLSNSGVDTKKFTKVVVPKKKYAPSSEWKQEYVYITGVSGDVNIGWHVTSATTSTYVYLDNVFVEEVIGCPEPLKLDVKDVEKNKATIGWSDDFGATGFEYYVQEAGLGTPTVSGTPTTSKSNVVSKDQTGKNLVGNTDYEFYVRTVCGNGGFSIWNGPFKFVTLCDIYATPFWEGFNSDSKSIRCWSNIDKKGMVVPFGSNWRTTTGAYEGNQALYVSLYDGTRAPFDDWLISPTVAMDGGMYVLKYHYKTNSSTTSINEFEVMLSTQGADVSKFTTTVVASKNYREGNYVEEVVFISGITGNVNIAWHTKSKETTSSTLYLDNVNIKKVETCPEPYYVKVSNQTTSSLDVEWQQTGGITSWEVLVVNYGEDETATPVKTVPVTGSPKTTITGLNSGTAYTVYVRTKCADGKSNSEWSTPTKNGTKIGANDNCSGALNIPVNSGGECESVTRGSLFGSNLSTKPEPSCLGAGTTVRRDAWFEFTATNVEHMFSMSDYFSLSNAYFPTINVSIYDQDCSTIGNAAMGCFNFSSTVQYQVLKGLVVGKKYYIRMATTTAVPDFFFSLCISSPSFIDVSPAGTKYTVEQLVKEVLVVADCDLVSNVTYTTGTNFVGEPNGIGYFEGKESPFAFKDGIILATNGVETSKGPSGQNQTNGTNKWLGDTDLQKLLTANGQMSANHNASVIEFDFIPITDTIKFDFIFASNEYGPSFQCSFSDVFAFFLTDLETSEMTNLAVVPGTDTPVSVTTIRDARYQGSNTCGNTNEKYFDKFYNDDIGLPQRDNPINYFGMTVPMTAISKVIPGKKYHIKLAIADYSDSSFNSAVFLEGGSFDLGRIDLGKDLLVENGTALCSGESRLIKSGVMTDGVDIKWFKDDVLIPGANTPDLEVFETGVYKITVKYLNLGCETLGAVKVEIFPAISKVVSKPVQLPICRTSLGVLELNLTSVEEAMLSKVDPVNYKMIYYKSLEDAKAGIASIAEPATYGVEATSSDIVIYIYVEDIRTGCSEIFEWTLKATVGIIPASRENVTVCATYTLPALEKDQHYYTGSKATGVEYKAGDVITDPKVHTIYVLQDNGGGCYEEISFKVAITEAVKADVFQDVNYECELYVLKPLTAHNKYFTQAGGQGVELAVGSLIPHAQTVYVYAASPDALCIDESSFKVTYADCPIQKGISPNGDGLNDSFDLSPHGVTSLVIYNRFGAEVFAYKGAYTNQWKGQGKGGEILPDGTYFYMAIAHGKTKSGWVQINK